MGLMDWILGLGSIGADVWNVERANQENRRNVQLQRDIYNQARSDIMGLPGWSEGGLTYTLGGQTFNAPARTTSLRDGTSPRTTESLESRSGTGLTTGLNLDNLFTSGQEIRDYLTTAETPSVTAPDLYGTQANVSSILAGSGARGNFGAELGDFDASARRAAALEGIGQQSQARSAANRQSAISSGLAAGRGLQDIESTLSGQDYAEETTRAGQALQSAADIETLAQQHDALRAQLEQEAGLAQQRTIGEQDTALANILAGLGTTEAGLGLQAGTFNATQQGAMLDRVLQAIQQGDADTLNRMNSLLALQGLDLQRLGIQSGTLSNLAGGEAGAIAGYEPNIWQISPAVTNWLNARNMSNYQQSESKSGANIGLFGFEVGATCIDGAAVVFDRIGPRPFRDAKVGDELLGSDGKFHRVEAVEYGWLEPTDRAEPHVQIETHSGRKLILTVGHPISGTTAGELSASDTVRVLGGTETIVSVRPTDYVPSGDVKLEDGVELIVNGFVVGSAIAKRDETLVAQGESQ